MSESEKRWQGTFWIFLAALFVLVLWMAKKNALTFPFPSEDDSSFFIPAWNLAVHGNLEPQTLNAPHGIYWMPHGYTLWIGFFLWLFGPTVEVARSVNQAATAAAVTLLTWAGTRISRSIVFGGLCAALLISPAVILVANTIRMESLIVLIYSIAILLHTYRRYVLAAEVLCVSLLVHPALMFSIVLYLVSLAFLYKEWRSNRWRDEPQWIGLPEAIVGALLLAAFAGEAILVLRHMDLFRQHMGFQAQRKVGRSFSTIMSHKRGILLAGEVVLAALGFFTARRIRNLRPRLTDLLPVAAAALGLQVYAAFGFEGPYAIYSYAIVPANLLCVAYGAVSILNADRAAKTSPVT